MFKIFVLLTFMVAGINCYFWISSPLVLPRYYTYVPTCYIYTTAGMYHPIDCFVDANEVCSVKLRKVPPLPPILNYNYSNTSDNITITTTADEFDSTTVGDSRTADFESTTEVLTTTDLFFTDQNNESTTSVFQHTTIYDDVTAHVETSKTEDNAIQTDTTTHSLETTTNSQFTIEETKTTLEVEVSESVKNYTEIGTTTIHTGTTSNPHTTTEETPIELTTPTIVNVTTDGNSTVEYWKTTTYPSTITEDVDLSTNFTTTPGYNLNTSGQWSTTELFDKDLTTLVPPEVDDREDDEDNYGEEYDEYEEGSGLSHLIWPRSN